MALDGIDIRRHTDCQGSLHLSGALPAVRRWRTARHWRLPVSSWAQQPIDRNSEVLVTKLDGSGIGECQQPRL